ncbi:hypothetical protein AWC38_SpisGene3845 [Stylophora pistillata]|uniref:Uncharacterized protein n=1 Tax=Stylophora pistillata TaxID=50429 RepID=A0A2B4SS60_STYPI|nr:hypothetical protein AWC38_SpisGene3845 [Stylophora pistillata]
MTVVMGITWILGFLLAFYPTPYVEYPFIIIKTCQGLVITISFAFSKHVFALYKQKFKSETHPEPSTIGAGHVHDPGATNDAKRETSTDGKIH